MAVYLSCHAKETRVVFLDEVVITYEIMMAQSIGFAYVILV